MTHKNVPDCFNHTLASFESMPVFLEKKVDEDGVEMERVGYSYSARLQITNLVPNLEVSAFEATMIIPVNQIMDILNSKKADQLIEASCFEGIMEDQEFYDTDDLARGTYISSEIDSRLPKSATILANLLSTLGLIEPYSLGSSYYRKKPKRSPAPKENYLPTPNGAFYQFIVEYIG